jgi:hypothetical protein
MKQIIVLMGQLKNILDYIFPIYSDSCLVIMTQEVDNEPSDSLTELIISFIPVSVYNQTALTGRW